MKKANPFFSLVFFSLTLAIFLLLSCSPKNKIPSSLSVATCANFQHTMKKLSCSFFEKENIRIEVIAGSSGNLFAQIIAGAPYDLFFSANKFYPERLKSEGVTQDVQVYAKGQLVLWWDRQLGPSKEAKIEDILLHPKVSRIALANPQHAPYGEKALEVIQYYKLAPLIQTKLVYGKNLLQAAQFAQTKNVEVAFLSLSLVLQSNLGEKGYFSLIPPESHQALDQAFTILAPHLLKEEKKRFADFIYSSPGQKIIQEAGYLLP